MTRRLLMLFTIAASLLAPIPATAVVGEGTSLPGFVESWGCDDPATTNPLSSRTGWLYDNERIRGPRGDFFGRTVGAVRDQLVWWTVPMSGGDQILVHARALPAFQQVSANLAAEQAAGRYYAVRPQHTYGFAARTIKGKLRISNHTFGTAVDVNSTTNPYRGDNVLITDMPDWYVQAWRDAGFCWGGDWRDIKDPMHFSWKGPAATPGYVVPPSQPVATQPVPFGGAVADKPVVFGAPDPGRGYALGDANGDGATDVVQVSQRDYGILLEYSSSSRDFAWCSVGRFHVPDVTIGDRTVLLGDFQGFGRDDVALVDGSGGVVEIEVHHRALDVLEESIVFSTTIPAVAGDTYLLGDQDRDGSIDLFVLRASGRLEVWDGGSGFEVKVIDEALPFPAPAATRHFTLGDHDRDDRPDLYALDAQPTLTTVRVAAHASRYATLAQEYTASFGGSWADVTIADYDGDGRGDLIAYDDSGRLTARLGNTALPGASPDGWFLDPEWDCEEEEDPRPYVFDGVFYDDDGNVHEQSIEWIAAADITRGCNPPYADAYCPDRVVTRGQMAALLSRALGLAGTAPDRFVDDGESEFEADIDRLAAAGITKGCNPPENDRFCPDRMVTRGEMAAFLVRAFALPAGPENVFTDDDGSVFEAQIDRLAAAGVTRGCNPPVNDRYCPGQAVRRDEMASFLTRALQLD